AAGRSDPWAGGRHRRTDQDQVRGEGRRGREQAGREQAGRRGPGCGRLRRWDKFPTCPCPPDKLETCPTRSYYAPKAARFSSRSDAERIYTDARRERSLLVQRDRGPRRQDRELEGRPGRRAGELPRGEVRHQGG